MPGGGRSCARPLRGLLAVSAEEQRIRTLCVQYIKSPSTMLAASLLVAASSLPLRTLGDDLHRRLLAQQQLMADELSAATRVGSNACDWYAGSGFDRRASPTTAPRGVRRS